MRVKASVGRNAPKDKRSLFDHCEILDLRADRLSEATWMAELARLFSTNKGGELVIKVNGRDPVEVVFSPEPPPCPSPDPATAS